jgi:hypothetical protein
MYVYILSIQPPIKYYARNRIDVGYICFITPAAAAVVQIESFSTRRVQQRNPLLIDLLYVEV